MTLAQERLYWRLWQRACQAQKWSSSDSERRHEMHAQALGRNKSHKFFTNPDFDRVKALFQHLADSTSLPAALEVEAYTSPVDDPGERRRLLHVINKLLPVIAELTGRKEEDYLGSVLADLHGGAKLSGIPNEGWKHHDLDGLKKLLNNRLHSLIRKVKNGQLPSRHASTWRRLSYKEIIGSILSQRTAVCVRELVGAAN